MRKHSTVYSYVSSNSTVNESGCWIWNLHTTKFGDPAGSFLDKTITITKALWKEMNPTDRHTKRKVYHRCGERLCVNPEHFYQKDFEAIVMANFDQNITLNEMVKRTGLSKISIERVLRKKEIKKTPPYKGFRSRYGDPEFIEKFKSLYFTASTKEINKALGLKHDDLYSIAKKLGLPSRGKHWKLNKHPKGMLGKKQSDEKKSSQSYWAKAYWQNPNGRGKFDSEESHQKRSKVSSDRMINRLKTNPSNCYSRAKRGYRADIGDYFFRSRWEANYARYLNTLKKNGHIVSWEFEADTFWFENIKRGVRSYMPDFKVTYPDGRIEYHEIKGWMDPKSATKLKRMAKYHPDKKIVLIDAKAYRELERELKNLIPNWEISN